MLGPVGGLHRHRLGVRMPPSHPFPGFGIRSTVVVFGRACASLTGMNSPVLASLPRGVDDSAPWPGFGTRSTVVVFGRWRASFTGMNCPVPASRPRSDELPLDDPDPLPLAIENLQPFFAEPFPPSLPDSSSPQSRRPAELRHSLSGLPPIAAQARRFPPNRMLAKPARAQGEMPEREARHSTLQMIRAGSPLQGRTALSRSLALSGPSITTLSRSMPGPVRAWQLRGMAHHRTGARAKTLHALPLTLSQGASP